MLRDAALDYVSRGWPVVKCRPRQKRPATPHGVKDATTDENVIRDWFPDGVDANLGIATGDGPVVLDIDPRNGGDESIKVLIEKHGTSWLNTATVITGGGGTHHYFNQLGRLRSHKPAPGLDLQACGYFVLAPPSVHPSGEPYRWDVGKDPDNMSLLQLPEFLLPLESNHPVMIGDAVVREFDALQGIPEGDRNRTLFRYGCRLRSREISYSEARLLIVEVAERCSPPLAESEALRCLDSAWRYSPDFKCTELGNAKRLVNLYGEDLCYIPEYGKWATWDGNRWLFDITGEVERQAKETTRAIYAEAFNQADETRRRDRAKWATQSESKYRIRAMVDLTKTERGIPRPQSELDSDPMLLGLNNGLLDLNIGSWRESRRDDYITKRANVTFDADAPCPMWLSFLERIMDGNKPLMNYLQRMVGYMLTGETREQCIFIALGSGANGKTTFANIIKGLMGDYALTTSPETLMLKRHTSGTTPDLARLPGARLVLASEGEEGARLAESLVKQLTGGDSISARALYRDPFEFTPTFKILLSTNHEPIIVGDDHAIWRRIHLIPFEVTIPPEERDSELGKRLVDELSGILNWALRGCLQWQCEGLQPPAEVTRATDEYREDMDIVGGWLDACCETDPEIVGDTFTPLGTLYASFEAYVKKAGFRPLSANSLGRKLKRRGFERARDARIRGYKGITLRRDDNGFGGDILNWGAR